MKNTSLFLFNTLLKRTPLIHCLGVVSLMIINAYLADLSAQTDPVLSIQGILKKSSGEAVPDGNYDLTFNLYTVPTGGVTQWTEMQDDVEVISGIYSTVLGNIEPLDISFDQIYYLGVKVGSTEMTPRIQLTSAPYALALIGENNRFPSSGQVIADSIEVNGNILTENGAPGPNGSNRNGYGFLGDRDSGLFSTPANGGEVSLFVNNVELLEVKPALVDIKTDVSANSLQLDAQGKLSYNGQDDWRLVETDYFQNLGDYEGWQVYNPLVNEWIGWNNGSAAGNPTLSGVTNHFEGRWITALENQVLKKSFNLSTAGQYNYIKVKFKFYFFDSADAANASGMVIGWMQSANWISNYTDLNTTAFQNSNKWGGDPAYLDYSENGEMTFFKCTSCNNIFWLMFGVTLDQAANNENYGVGMIEIWVK
jgi:hypothetical protein